MRSKASLIRLPRTPSARLVSSRVGAWSHARIHSARLRSTPAKTCTRRPRLRGSVSVRASVLKVTESATGVEFPLVRRFWEGDEYRCLGAAPRLKKFLFINAKVYAIALYVEAAKAAQELKLRDRGDFFKDADQSAFCDAIVDGAFNKALQVMLQITLVRDITSDQFVDAIESAIGAKLRFIGASDVFEEFKAYIESQELQKGKTIVLHWSVNGYLDVGVLSEDVSDLSVAMDGMKRFENAGFSRSMFELYLGSDAIIPDAKNAWAEGARLLLESAKI